MQIPEIDDAQADVPQTNRVAKSIGDAAPRRNADKRAAASLAKKKQKRAAHRVALRRSHTNG